MTDKRTTKEIVAVIDTKITYIEAHLRNINGNLEKQNMRIGDCEVQTAVSKASISRIWKIGGGICLGLLTVMGIIVAIAFGVFGIFS